MAKDPSMLSTVKANGVARSPQRYVGPTDRINRLLQNYRLSVVARAIAQPFLTAACGGRAQQWSNLNRYTTYKVNGLTPNCFNPSVYASKLVTVSGPCAIYLVQAFELHSLDHGDSCAMPRAEPCRPSTQIFVNGLGAKDKKRTRLEALIETLAIRPASASGVQFTLMRASDFAKSNKDSIAGIAFPHHFSSGAADASKHREAHQRLDSTTIQRTVRTQPPRFSNARHHDRVLDTKNSARRRTCGLGEASAANGCGSRKLV